MKLTALLLFTVLLALPALAQRNVKVNKTAIHYEPDEPSLYVNPLNPLNIIAGSNTDNFYYSFDGGLTWVEGELSSDNVWGDPVLYFDNFGNAYFTHLGKFQNTGILISRSFDGGQSWSLSKKIYGYDGGMPFQDKEWITSDRTQTSPFANNLYISWTEFDKYGSKDPADSSRILFSRSMDLGETFSYPIKISDKGGDAKDGDGTVEGAVPCVGPNGEIYISWAGPRGIEFNSSTDGGLSFGKDVKVTEQVGGWSYEIPGLYRCNGLPFTDCDISDSPYRGHIYINFSDKRNGDYDIFVVKSTNGGAAWSSAVRVNDDELRNGRDQFMSHFAVDPVTGNIHVLFYDRRNYSTTETDVYLASSTDGGQTWTNKRISETSFTPDPKIFFGDYLGVHARNDTVSAIWTRMDGKTNSLMFWRTGWE